VVGLFAEGSFPTVSSHLTFRGSISSGESVQNFFLENVGELRIFIVFRTFYCVILPNVGLDEILEHCRSRRDIGTADKPPGTKLTLLSGVQGSWAAFF
jgi:hypothetical protein